MLVRFKIRVRYKSTCRSLIERGRDSRWLLKRLRASSPLISEMVVGRFVSLLWDRVILVKWVTRERGEIYSVISDILGEKIWFITVFSTVRSLMIIGSVLVTWHYCHLSACCWSILLVAIHFCLADWRAKYAAFFNSNTTLRYDPRDRTRYYK